LSKRIFDKNRAYKQVTKEVHRANNLLSMFNHALLLGEAYYDGKIKEIMKPTLVIHGTDDTALVYEHGVALANEIPHASLLTLEGTGHEIHEDDWGTIIDAIVTHTKAVS
jgi:pimeloyl-ACP methyl ester carboxylesterase